jgi:hypothetical protein
MTTTFIVAGFISAVVLGGNIAFDKANKTPINWKRTLIWAGVAFAAAVGIGIITE